LPQIRKWQRKWPDSNVGIATGAVSGVVVMHVVGIEGIATLQSLVAQHGPLPQTAIAKTPLGLSFFFALSEGCESLSCPRRDGIEFYADGGFVVVPPSRICDHVCGGS
jgi:hypothetical protein